MCDRMQVYNVTYYIYSASTGVQEIRWEGDGTKPAGEYTFFYGNENENRELGTYFFLCIRESYRQLRGLSLLLIGCHILILRGSWCHILIVLNFFVGGKARRKEATRKTRT
jgi:hypothetical protein